MSSHWVVLAFGRLIWGSVGTQGVSTGVRSKQEKCEAGVTLSDAQRNPAGSAESESGGGGGRRMSVMIRAAAAQGAPRDQGGLWHHEADLFHLKWGPQRDKPPG